MFDAEGGMRARIFKVTPEQREASKRAAAEPPTGRDLGAPPECAAGCGRKALAGSAWCSPEWGCTVERKRPRAATAADPARKARRRAEKAARRANRGRGRK